MFRVTGMVTDVLDESVELMVISAVYNPALKPAVLKETVIPGVLLVFADVGVMESQSKPFGVTMVCEAVKLIGPAGNPVLKTLINCVGGFATPTPAVC